eukprot:901374-Pyramimonas_sp.AAC.1
MFREESPKRQRVLVFAEFFKVSRIPTHSVRRLPKTAREGPKTAQRRPKRPPTEHSDSPTCSQDGPRRPRTPRGALNGNPILKIGEKGSELQRFHVRKKSNI